MIKNSYRTCLYSNKQYDKKELIRLVKEKNKLVIDYKQNKLGRGYWLKLTKQMFDDPKLIIILSKKTRSSIDEELINELRKML